MTAPHTRSRLRRGALALILGLAVAEVGLRLAIGSDGLLFGHPLPPFGAITHPRQRASVAELRTAPKGTGTFDVELGWTVWPGGKSPDGRAHVNSVGARGRREYAPAKPAGVTRIVCVGDSFTWGDEVGDEDTFEAQLEALEPAIECVNLGVAAYGTDQALLRWRRDGARLEPDLLVVGLLLENIGRNVNRYRPLWYPGSSSAPAKPRFVLRHGELELLPQPFVTANELADAIEDGSVVARLAEHEHWRPDAGPWRFSAIGRCFAALSADREREVERLWNDEDGEPFETTLVLLAAFEAPRVLVLVFPRETDARELLDDGTPYWSGLLRELERRQLAHLDLGAPLARMLAEHDRDHALPHPYAGGHLSRAGNALVARELLERSRGLPDAPR